MCFEACFRINGNTNVHPAVLYALYLIHKKRALLAPSLTAALAVICRSRRLPHLAFGSAAAIAGLQYTDLKQTFIHRNRYDTLLHQYTCLTCSVLRTDCTN